MKRVSKIVKKASLHASAAIFLGLVGGVEEAFAQGTTSGNTFSSIARNVNNSISELPGLLTGVSYMLGILLGVLGILKIKDHVENPTQTPLQHGAIRLAAGGGLFALPIIYESMLNTVGADGANATAARLNKVQFNVQ